MRIKLLAILYCITIAMSACAQDGTRMYSVRYKGEDIGIVRLTQSTNGKTLNYKMTSDIRTRFLFRISVKSVEESTFENGRLVYSMVNRTVNGNEKARRLTKAGDKVYNITAEGKSAVLKNEAIGYNLMRLYCVEPLNITRVYSDNYQQFLAITIIRPHTYKVELPDGNYNHYTYTNGICSKVEIFNPLYNMELILKR
jgi:uncharacterized protein DUF6134